MSWAVTGVPEPASGQSANQAGLSEEMDEVLQELEAADLPPSAEQQALWQQELERARKTSGGLNRSSWGGQARWRGYLGLAGLQKWNGRLEVHSGPARVRVRLGRDLAGTAIMGGALEICARWGRMVVGNLGMEAGAGLLLAGPGRGRTLAADGNLGRARARLAGWTGIPEGRTIQGVGTAGNYRQFSLEFMAGVLFKHLESVSSEVQAATVSWAGQSSVLSVSGLNAGNGWGLCLWGRGQKSILEWTAEVARWQPQSSVRPVVSWQAVVACRPLKDWLIQGGVAWGQGGPVSPLAVRSALLKGEQGRGWAFRGTWKASRGVGLAMLVTESFLGSMRPDPRRDLIRAWDFMVKVRTSPTANWTFRLRSTSRRRWEWSDRYRWLPAALAGLESRLQGQARFSWKATDFSSLVLTGNLLQKETTDGPSVRALAGISGNWQWSPEVQLRAGYGSAWGDPLDLVSAVSPLPGLVLPRHWGGWQSEIFLGIGLRKGGWRLKGAVSLRRASQLSENAGNVQAWLESGWAW